MGARLRGQRAQPKGDQAAEGLGRSRGGFSTKLHVLVDALGNPLKFVVTSGAAGDNPQAIPLLAGQRAREVIADRSYDADATIRYIEQELHATATIPPTSRRVQPRPCDYAAYKERHLAQVNSSTEPGSRRPLDALVGQCWRPDALSAVEHRPADVVPQPLVVEYELANRLRELVALPPALESTCALALSFRRGSTCGLDRVGGRTELVRGDVCDGRGLGGSVRGMPCCPTQVSGRGVRIAGRRASLGHRDLATHPGAGVLDRLTRSRVLRLSRLEEVKDVLRARCRPQGEELVIRIGEGPTAADRYETRVAVFREDRSQHPFCSHLPN